jgi:hypothetical protein
MQRRNAVMLALAFLVLGGLAPPARAQLSENLGTLTPENATKYLQPLADGLSGTVNSAIFTTGHVPNAGLTFQFGLKVMGIKYDPADAVYTPTDPSGFSGPDVPTVIGDETAVPHDGPGGAQVVYPGGFNTNEFAFAAPQLTIGSVIGTSATVRWLAHTFNDAADSDKLLEKIDYFGIGAQHSISQYFSEPAVDLAFGVFYQTLDLNDDLVKVKSLHVDVTGSKSFGIFQPYGAVGFDSFEMDAKYEDSTSPGDFIAVNFERSNHVHLTAGLLANLSFIKLHGELNFAEKNGAAVGLSFGK